MALNLFKFDCEIMLVSKLMYVHISIALNYCDCSAFVCNLNGFFTKNESKMLIIFWDVSWNSSFYLTCSL